MWRACGPLAGGTPALPGCGPVSDVLGARASGPQRAEGPQSADKNDTPEPATPPPEAEGPQSADRSDTPEPATPPSRPHPRLRHPMPSRSVLGALPRTGAGEARERGRRPLAHVAGLWPACGRDARAPRDGARASLADPAPQGHSKLSARRLMGPCREQVHGLRQGTSLWPVTCFSPAERESDCASSIRGNPMNLGAPTPA